MARCTRGERPKWLRKTFEKCDVDWNPQAIAISVTDCSVCTSRFCARFSRISMK